MAREPSSDAMMALHAAHCARLEEDTPGLNPVMPARSESFAAERSRLAIQGERRMRIRGDALWRLLAQRLAPIEAARRGGFSASGGHLTLWFSTHDDAVRATALLVGTVADLSAFPARGPRGLPGITGTLDAAGPAMFGQGPDPVGDFLRAERDAALSTALMPIAAE